MSKGFTHGRAGVAAAIVVALAATGVALAAIPSNGVISACYTKPGGNLRVIDATTGSCTPKEQSLSWNVQGATGPQGPAGGPGPTGPEGPAGPANVVVRSKEINGVGGVRGTVDCADGERATGGGFDARGNGATLTIYENHPVPTASGGVPTGWTVDIGVPDMTYPYGLGVLYVICAS